MKGMIACRIMFNLLCLLWPGVLLSQVWDDFNDGDFSNGVNWTGDTAQFAVNGGVLQLNSTGSDSSFLVTSGLQLSDTIEWRFKIRMDFSPSSLNYARYYLCSGNADLCDSLSGYFLQFGESGSGDAVCLYKQNAYTTTLLTRAADSMISAPFVITVKVLRMQNGLWNLYVDYAGGEDYLFQCSVYDATIIPDMYTGWKCVYTTSNADKFFLDEVYAGPYIYDTIAPEVKLVSIVSDSVVQIRFSEEPDSMSVFQSSHFQIAGVGFPDLIYRDTAVSQSYFLSFPVVFSSALNYELSVFGIEDIEGNVQPDTFSFHLFKAAAPSLADLVISEIMADPASAPLLPPYEYFEIYNRSTKTILADGFSISDKNTIAYLPSDTIFPGQYRGYTDLTSLQYFQAGGMHWIKAVLNLPSLNNEGDSLQLLDDKGNVLDVVNYDNSMYKDPLRDDKGWSLERIDVGFPCGDKENWAASRDPSGGTPGFQNSINAVFQDTISLWPVYAFPLDSVTVQVCFSEFPDSIYANDVTLYFIDKDVGSPLSISFSLDRPCVLLKVSAALKAGTLYTIGFDLSFRDCAGNTLKRWNQLKFAFPDSAKKGDVILNEVLFNPSEEGKDFVEVFNNSDKCIDLSALKLAHADPLTGVSEEATSFSTEKRLLLPGEYAVATEVGGDIVSRFNVGDRRMLISCSLPSYNDDEGTVVLLNSSLQEFERFHYRDDFHFPLLGSTEGVSLERISTLRPANDSSNWHSAAAGIGYGSPCAINSQYYDNNLLEEQLLNVSPGLFSPDNDGYHDVLGISCKPSHPGYVVAVSVCNELGIPVRKLTQQELLGTEGHWTWDGLSDAGELLKEGIYVILLEMFHINGDTKVVKKAAVLAKRM